MFVSEIFQLALVQKISILLSPVFMLP